MVTIHNLGFPRIGKHRELKFALEKYWSNATSQEFCHLTGLNASAIRFINRKRDG
jgi:5-methyltetrahydropteroyltriglutamate--homocysteine methyltransferase